MFPIYLRIIEEGKKVEMEEHMRTTKDKTAVEVRISYMHLGMS